MGKGPKKQRRPNLTRKLKRLRTRSASKRTRKVVLVRRSGILTTRSSRARAMHFSTITRSSTARKERFSNSSICPETTAHLTSSSRSTRLISRTILALRLVCLRGRRRFSDRRRRRGNSSALEHRRLCLVTLLGKRTSISTTHSIDHFRPSTRIDPELYRVSEHFRDFLESARTRRRTQQILWKAPRRARDRRFSEARRRSEISECRRRGMYRERSLPKETHKRPARREVRTHG